MPPMELSTKPWFRELIPPNGKLVYDQHILLKIRHIFRVNLVIANEKHSYAISLIF